MIMTVVPMLPPMVLYIIGMQLITQQVFVLLAGMYQVIHHGQYLRAIWRLMAITMMEVQRVMHMQNLWLIVSVGILIQVQEQ